MKTSLRNVSSLVASALALALLAPPTWATEEDGLSDLTLEELMKIVITSASKREESIYKAPSVMEVITAEEIKKLGANNLRDVLDRATSVQVIGSDFNPENVVSIRGQALQHENNHVLMLINGRPLRESTSQGLVASFLAGFPLDLVESIEIIRGPGSVLYGSSAFSGVINVKTVSVDQLETAALKATYGSFNSIGFDGHAAIGSEDASLLIGVKSWDSDGWTIDFTDQTGNSDSFKTADDDIGIVLTANYRKLSVNGFYGRTRQHAVQPTGTYPIRTLDHQNGFLDLGYEHGVGRGWKANYNLTYNEFDMGDVNITNDDLLGEVTFGGAVGEKVQLLVGGVYERHHVVFEDNELANQKYVNTSKKLYTLYGQADWDALDWLKLTLGFQYAKEPDLPSGTSPRLGAVGHFESGWGFKLLYGEAFRTATWVERAIDAPGIIVGNPELQPETIATAEAQVNHHGTRHSVALTYYHSTMEDLIKRVGFPIEFENLGEIVFDGVEAEGKLIGDSYSLFGSVTYQTNEDENGVKNSTFTPEWMAKAGATFDVTSGFTLGVADSYFGDPTQVREVNPWVAEVNPEPQSYHLVTLNAMLDFNELTGKKGGTSWKLQVFFDNVLDEEIHFSDINSYHVNSFQIRSGRAVYARVTVGF